MPAPSTKISQVIHNNYDGLSVVLNTQVSYVNLLQGRRDNRSTFICVQKDRVICKPTKSLKSPKFEEKKDDDLNLTGSPLKDDFQIEILNMSIETKDEHYKPWSDTEECYSGVNVNIARSIVSEIADLEDPDSRNGSLWMLCDGLDPQSTLLIENEFTPTWWIRGTVESKDPVAIETVKMDQLISVHLNRYPELKTFDTEIESTFYLRYNIHVRVDMSFHKQLPSFTYFQGARVTLKQFLPKSEDTVSTASSFWCDILTLNYIKKYILDFPSSNKNEPNYDCGTGMKLRGIKEEIATIFTTVVFCTDLNDQDEGLDREDLEAVVASAKNRDYTDITDSLWNLLKCCASFGDLKAAFNYMFHFVQMNNIVNIPANKNHLATLIKEISEGRLTNLCLSGTEPLELLLEIGLEKVEKDYEFIFIRSKTTTAQDLQSCSEFYKENVTMKSDGMVRKSVFHSAKNNKISEAATSRTTLLMKAKDQQDSFEDRFHYSDFDENEIELKLCKLAHFHGILKHLLLLKTEFNNVDVFTLIMDHMLQQPMHYPFKIVRERGFKDLEMEVVNNSLLKLVKEKSPNIRRVTLETKKSLIEVRTTFVHSLDPIFPSGANEVADLGREEKDEKTILSQQFYHNYLYRNVRTKF